MQTEVIVALIVSGLALIGVIINAGLSAKKTDLEVLRGIIAELQKVIDGLKEKISTLECENADLVDWAERLATQIKWAGMSPVKFIRHGCKDKKED